MFNKGNVNFCSNCHNLMIASSDDSKLKWECSIECSNEDDNIIDVPIVLLESSNIDGTDTQTNQYDANFTTDDPTLLRCSTLCKNCNQTVEALIFKENVATNNSSFICTICKSEIRDDK